MSPHTFSGACRHLESLGPAAAAQYHTRTPSCRGMNPFRPVYAHPMWSVRRQPRPSSRTQERGHHAGGRGSPGNKAREPGVGAGSLRIWRELEACGCYTVSVIGATEP